MTKEQLIDIIQEGQKHQNHARTVEIASFAKQIMTGEGQDDLIVSYKPRENAEQKQQRIKLYNSLTGFAAGQVVSIYNKVQRVDNLKKEVSHKSEKGKGLLDAKVSKFYRGQSLDDYLFQNLEHLNFYDPNALILIDRVDVFNETGLKSDVRIIPVIFKSNQVIHIEQDEMDITAVVLKKERHLKVPKTEQKLNIGKDGLPIKSETENKTACTFWLYQKQFGIRLKEVVTESEEVYNDEQITIEIEGKPKLFEVTEFIHGSVICPVVRVGSYMDAQTDCETFVTPLEPAKHIFKDLINLKSEFDLTRALHTFLQKISLAPKCKHRVGNHICTDGYIGEKICENCEGLGFDVHKTSQDVIYLNFPDTKDELIPLAEFTRYIELPEWLPKWQDEQIEKAVSKISLAIFNTEVFKRPQVAATATEVNVEYDKVYDIIYSYSKAFSNAYKRIIEIVNDYLELGDGLKVVHEFPRDFKMKSIGELLAELKTARESGANHIILNQIEMDVFEKLYADDPNKIKKLEVYQKLKPFSDKQAAEIVAILSTRAPDDPERALYENFERVFQILTSKDENFTNKTFDIQLKEAKEIALQLHSESKFQTFQMPDFGGA